MVDDIKTTSECGTTTVALNARVNSFVERKKLGLSFDKCARIHIGKKSHYQECHNIKVHKEDMKSSEKEKYLGDFVTKHANANDTLMARKARAFAILSEIKVLLYDIPLGSRKVETGLALREAWFINGILFNSEVWGTYTEKYVNDLEVIDHMILRAILGAQSKVTVETLYLETGAMSIKNVISVRRMLYLKTILDRHDNEIIKKVYIAMKSNPHKGDWIKLVERDFQKIGLDMDDKLITEMNLNNYKSLIKKSVWNAFFKELQETKLTHIKVKHIEYNNSRKPQKYLTNGKFDNKLASLLFNLRCRSTNEFRDNQHTLYGKEPLCTLCKTHIDSQENALSCVSILKELTTSEKDLFQTSKYSDLFGGEDEQLKITRVYQIILATRERLQQQGLPGPNNLGPD
jgi:hypothetical protein